MPIKRDNDLSKNKLWSEARAVTVKIMYHMTITCSIYMHAHALTSCGMQIVKFLMHQVIGQLELIKHILRALALSTVLIQEPMSCQRPFSYNAYSCDADFAWTTLTFV